MRLPSVGLSVARSIREANRNTGMNRSADWLHQAHADLDQALVSAGAGHHEWACFACHQAVEKAFNALHLSLGQQVWGMPWGPIVPRSA